MPKKMLARRSAKRSKRTSAGLESEGLFLQIRHPKAKSKVPPSFVAFGRARKVLKHLVGILVDKENHAFAGKVLGLKPIWKIRFKDIPRGKYLLKVFDPFHPIVEDSVLMEVVGPSFAGAIDISYPLAGATVDRIFVSYGTGTVAAVIGDFPCSMGHLCGAATLEEPPAWSIEFNVRDTVAHYPSTLTVQEPLGGGGANDNEPNISVNP